MFFYANEPKMTRSHLDLNVMIHEKFHDDRCKSKGSSPHDGIFVTMASGGHVFMQMNYGP